MHDLDSPSRTVLLRAGSTRSMYNVCAVPSVGQYRHLPFSTGLGSGVDRTRPHNEHSLCLMFTPFMAVKDLLFL